MRALKITDFEKKTLFASGSKKCIQHENLIRTNGQVAYSHRTVTKWFVVFKAFLGGLAQLVEMPTLILRYPSSRLTDGEKKYLKFY